MNRLLLKENAVFRYVTFFYLYIMQGIPAGFALTAISNYLLGNHIAPQKVGTFIALFGLPWTLQFVWGPLIDRFQYSIMGHRKHWVVFAQIGALLASLGLLMVKSPLAEIPLMSAIFFVYSIFSSIVLASVDAMAISLAPIEQRGRLNGYMRGGFLLGTAFGAAVLSHLLHTRGFSSAVLVQSVILLIFSIVFFFTKLESSDSLLPWTRSIKDQQVRARLNPKITLLFKNVFTAITNQKSLRYLALVAMVYFCSSVFIRSYTYYLIHELHWSDDTVSLLQGSWGSLITFAAIIVAGTVSDKMGAKKLQVIAMWSVCLFLIILNISYQLWNHQLYSGAALLLWNLADPLLSVTIFPILMGLCWQKVEGSQFTAYLALINLCDVIGSYLTGWLLNTVAAPLLGLFCGILLLTVLVALKWKGNYRIIPD